MDAKTRKRLRRLLAAEKRVQDLPSGHMFTVMILLLWILAIRGCS